MRRTSGFTDTKLHRRLDTFATFRSVNVARRESVEARCATFSEFRPRGIGPGVMTHPALYEVAATY
jgi:hypothetical protein